MDSQGRYAIDRHGHPLLEGAFKIAEKAHAREFRRDGRPYIEHCKLAYLVADGFGCNDYQKAVLLLHDVIETRLEEWEVKLGEKEFLRREDELRQSELQTLKQELEDGLRAELEKKFKGRDVTHSRRYLELSPLTARVAEGVLQLTNRKYPEEGKRTYQTDQARRLTAELRGAKIIDQTVSIIDDIQYVLRQPSEEQLTAEQRAERLAKREQFAPKATDVAEAARGSGRETIPEVLYQFYRRIYKYYQEITDTAQYTITQIDEARSRGFDLMAEIAETNKLRGMHAEHSARAEPELVENPRYRDMMEYGASFEHGVTDACVVGGRVVRYSMLTGNAQANEKCVAMRRAIQLNRPTEVRTGDASTFTTKEGNSGTERAYNVDPPLPVERFVTIGRALDVIDGEFARLLLAHKKIAAGANKSGKLGR